MSRERNVTGDHAKWRKITDKKHRIPYIAELLYKPISIHIYWLLYPIIIKIRNWESVRIMSWKRQLIINTDRKTAN